MSDDEWRVGMDMGATTFGRLWRLDRDGQIVGPAVPFVGGEMGWSMDTDDGPDDLVTLAETSMALRWQITEAEFWAILSALVEPDEIARVRQDITDWDRWEDDGGTCFD